MNSVSIYELIKLFIYKKKFIAIVSLFFCFCGFLVAIVQTPLYKSTALLQINPHTNNSLNIDSTFNYEYNSKVMLRSEIDIIKSLKIARAVSEELKLKENSESILKNIRVNSRSKSYNMFVSYISPYKNESARILNAILEKYLQEKLYNRFSNIDIQNKWLRKKIKSLKIDLNKIEQKISSFSQYNNIFEKDGENIKKFEINELLKSLSAIKSKKADYKAKINRSKNLIKDGDIKSIYEIAQSESLNKLREEENLIMSTKNELETRYGEKHPKIINIKLELDSHKIKIKNEVLLVIKSFAAEIENLNEIENELKLLMKSTSSDLNTNKDKLIEFDNLKREQKSIESIYNLYLNKLNSLSQKENYSGINVNIVYEGEVPKFPFFPKKKYFSLLGLILGVFISFGLVIYNEFCHLSFTSLDEIEKLTSLKVLSIFPNIFFSKKNKGNTVLEDSMKEIKKYIFSKKLAKSQTVLFTSSVSKEGKSFLSKNIAKSLSKNHKVIIIDCDTRLSFLSKSFSIQSEYDLISYLEGKKETDQIINKVSDNLDFISCLTYDDDKTDLIASERMANLMKKLKEKYEYVILDSTPVNLLPESIFLSKISDINFYIVLHNKINKNAVQYGINQFKKYNSSLDGIILNKASLLFYEKYKSKYYYYGYH